MYLLLLSYQVSDFYTLNHSLFKSHVNVFESVTKIEFQTYFRIFKDILFSNFFLRFHPRFLITRLDLVKRGFTCFLLGVHLLESKMVPINPAFLIIPIQGGRTILQFLIQISHSFCAVLKSSGLGIWTTMGSTLILGLRRIFGIANVRPRDPSGREIRGQS